MAADVHRRQPGLLTHPWVDTSCAPLCVLTYPREREFNDMMAAHDTVASIYRHTEGHIGWIVDASRVVSATPRERQVVVAHERRVADMEAQRCVGIGLVIPNALVRGFYTAIRWIEPARCPFEILPTLEEAEAWVRARLASAGR